MTLKNPFTDLCLVVQATRRECERSRNPIALATGVAASIYTHQLANALRVLVDLRVRHLLADEVGLGKTVQALMVLNALSGQRSELRTLIIVPNRLVPQWRDEILTRAHAAPTDEDLSVSGNHRVRLAWEDQLQKNENGESKWSLADIDPVNYDLLIVDELHRLRSDVQDRIVRVAPDFDHLLILTATPAFQKPERHAQLFAMLEPERTAIARWNIALDDVGIEKELSPSDDLAKWPTHATINVVKAILDRDRNAAISCAEDDESREIAAVLHCAYRRVIRTRRIDFSGVLPRRKHISIVTEPLGAEVERQSLMWRYFQHLSSLSIRLETVSLAKRVILSPPSLEQRVDFLRRKGFDRDGLLELVKPLVHRSQGDSRLDALIDLLAEIWRVDPQERVLVAAQDNLTVDYLFKAVMAKLPIIGPLADRVPLIASCIRQGMMTEAVEDIGGFGNETNENLEAFQRGDAQVLFAPEAAQVGLNLQCARILILYSVSWKPEEVEQWIGRLDRIGNVAAFSSAGDAKTILIYTITQRGLVDEKVVSVLQRFHVFEQSVNLDGDHLDEVANLIESAALRPSSVNWKHVEDATEAMAVQDQIQELNSELRGWLPWTVDWAKSVRKRFEDIPPLPPVIVKLPEYSETGPRSWDRATEGLTKLLARSGEYHIRVNDDESGGSKFQTLWYQYGERGAYGGREVYSRVQFSFGADPWSDRSPRNSLAFITRRGDIGIPPRRSVTMSLAESKVTRSLRFLNFGDPLHDELVSGWSQRRITIPSAIDLQLFRDHELYATSDEGYYLVSLSVMHSTSTLSDRLNGKKLVEIMANSLHEVPSEKLVELLAPYVRRNRCALEADIRWLQSELPAQLFVRGLYFDKTKWRVLDDKTVAILLNPMAHPRPGIPQSSTLHASRSEAEMASLGVEQIMAMDRGSANSVWSHHLPSFDRALKLRMESVLEESKDAQHAIELELAGARRRLEIANERGIPAQITRAEGICLATQNLLRLTRVVWEMRLSWLRELGTAVRQVSPDKRVSTLIRVRKI
jgi:ATP-dependent helicase HepA